MAPWVQILGTLCAAVIGGIIAPQITQARERRAARADVLTKVNAAEALRWGGENYQEFMRALAALESAAVIARVPRSTIRTYAKAAKAARDSSVEVDMGDYMGWVVDPAGDAAVETALETLSQAIWHPWLSCRLRRRAENAEPAG
jgi:choline dehydrogenase-like flavoprotein